MRYLIRQKYFAVRDRFNITDEGGNTRFQVVGKLVSIGKKFSICRANGNEIYKINQKIFHLFPRFKIMSGTQEVAVFKGQFALFTKKAKIISEYGNFKVKGNVFAWDFRIIDGNGQAVATVSKKVLKIADTYTIDVRNGSDDALWLSVIVILDAIYHKKH